MLSAVINKVWETFKEPQTLLLENIARNIRQIDESLITTVVEDWKKAGMFFLPNSTMLPTLMGDWVKDPQYGIYDFTGACNLTARLLIPLRTFDNSVIGFVGYNKETDRSDFVKYMYPNSSIFKKRKYLYMDREEWIRAYQEQVVVIVDGLFDKRMLNLLGIPACSICGSELSEYHKLYLNRIKHKVILADNDSAGCKLAETCKRELDAVQWYINGVFKDIDSVISTGQYQDKILESWENLKRGGFLISEKLNL